MAKLALVVAALTVFGTLILAFVVAGDASQLEQIPGVASNLLAWGAGVLFAFGASVRALPKDREEGIRDLYRARGQSDTAYLWARVGGLGIELAWVTAGGTLVCGVVAALVANGGAASLRTLGATLASVVFSLAFALVLAPVAMATLGVRSRMGGYLALVAVLGLPELAGRWTARVLPEGWGELGSIPGAMLALRSALVPGHLDVMLAFRAAAVLALVAAVALLILRAEQASLGSEPPPGGEDGTQSPSPRRGQHAGARA